jgi:hypothetical protein
MLGCESTAGVSLEIPFKNQGRATHGGDIKIVPARRDTVEYQPVGFGKNRAGYKPDADGQGVVLEGYLNSHIHGTETIADTIA